MGHGQLLILAVLTQRLNESSICLSRLDRRKVTAISRSRVLLPVALIGQTLFGNLDFSSTVLSVFDAANGEIVETSRVFLQRHR